MPFKRGARAHVAVVEHLSGAPLKHGWQVHHMDGNKLNCMPENLLYAPAIFNPSPARRCPITGLWMSPAAYARRYGTPVDEPSWITSTEFEEECA